MVDGSRLVALCRYDDEHDNGAMTMKRIEGARSRYKIVEIVSGRFVDSAKNLDEATKKVRALNAKHGFKYRFERDEGK